MIPKIIHYCWFGRNTKPKAVEYYIKSWKEILPDYEIIEWNEDNFDININYYVKEAYENKKWAFVTDYVRLFAIYNYGGIYLDTDVEVLKNLDSFLELNGFTGFEDENGIITAILASNKNNHIIKALIDYYDTRHFIIDDKLDLTTNVQYLTQIFINKYNLKLNNKKQILSDNDFVIFPKEYFSPKNYTTGKISITNNTYIIHHFNSSWVSFWQKYENKIRVYSKKILGDNFVKRVGFPYRIIRDIIKKQI